ncbi:maleylpyruvate isomerase [Nitratireductor sp. OM-1]|uniref:maleylpyruvate isomerase n=1 Tax=Nitratireductor sp. OM-1 TaxID=1756988 RepID=UPI000DDF595A|nr:maleylpyruvate isomerase [Nitratireductor sp. OM-1]
MSDLDLRRRELRERQGAGARYDAPEAPAEALDLMRRGTANFARILNDLPDAALYETVPRWSTRAHIVAIVGLQARRMSTALAALQRGGNASGDNAWSVARSAVDVTASLPPRALRNLFAHSQIHLNVVLRDLRGEDWGIALENEAGQSWTIADIPHHRATTLWQAAADLENSGVLGRDRSPWS